MTGPAVHTRLALEMTVDAGFHIQHASFADSLHTRNFAVACLASYLCGYMAFMSEVNEIRQVIDLDPLDRSALFPKTN